MNETLAKILKLIFNKTTLAYMVLGLLILYANFWFRKSDYSPRSIMEGQNEIRDFAISQAKSSNKNDSLQNIEIGKLSDDVFLMKIKVDTIINYQTPALINRINMLNTFYRQFNKSNKPTTLNDLQPIPIIKTQPIESKYTEALTLLDEIELTVKCDTTSKKKLIYRIFNIFKKKL